MCTRMRLCLANEYVPYINICIEPLHNLFVIKLKSIKVFSIRWFYACAILYSRISVCAEINNILLSCEQVSRLSAKSFIYGRDGDREKLPRQSEPTLPLDDDDDDNDRKEVPRDVSTR